MILILSGPSGVGKDTVIDAWQKTNHLVKRVVSATTRPPRSGEVDGVDYHFFSEIEFDEAAKAGQFLEHKLVHGSRYGTLRNSIDHLVSQGCIALLKIDVQGADAVRQALPDVVSVMILPPSLAELERRIRGRGTETEEKIQVRLNAAKDELSQASKYTYQLVNENVDSTVIELEKIVCG